MASAPVISAAAMIRGILRYESRAGAGPMQTSSSAKRTCSDSRSASEYTATVSTPSSRQARMTRSAISPRLAIRTFLNMERSGARRRAVSDEDFLDHLVRRPASGGGVGLEPGPAVVAGPGHTLHAERELAGAGGVEHGALVRDDALGVVAHQRLVEALHPVLHGAFLDQVGDVERLVHVADLVAHGLRVDEDLARRHAAGLVGAWHE